MSRLSDRLSDLGLSLQENVDGFCEWWYSEACRYYILIIVFFALVLVRLESTIFRLQGSSLLIYSPQILPMTPMLLFWYSDTEPSINPKVFDYLYNVAAHSNSGNKEQKPH